MLETSAWLMIGTGAEAGPEEAADNPIPLLSLLGNKTILAHLLSQKRLIFLQLLLYINIDRNIYIKSGRGNRFGNKQDDNSDHTERDHYAQSNTHNRHFPYVKKEMKKMDIRSWMT